MLRASAVGCILVSFLIGAACGSDSGRGPTRIVGKVILPGVADVSGIAVLAVGPTTSTATTAADGSYTMASMPPGSYLLEAIVDSTEEHTVTAIVTLAGVIDPVVAPDLVFSPLGTISGRVTLAGATTGNGGIAVYALEMQRATLTNDAGEFSLAVPLGTYTVGATKAGYAPGAATGITVTFRVGDEIATIDLQAAGSSGESSTSLAGIATLPPPASSAGTTVTVTGTSLSATTAADGSYSIADVPAGIYTLHFENGPYQLDMPGVVAIPNGNGYVIAASLQPIPGVVVPRARRIVSFSPVTVQTSANGAEVAVAWTDDAHIARSVVAAVAGGAPVAMPGPVLALSPDGKTAAVLEQVAGGSVVDLIATDGSTRRAVIGPQPLSPAATPRAAFTSDGATLVFELAVTPPADSTSYTVYGVAAASGLAQVIATGGQGLPFLVSAGGNVLYADDLGLEVVSASGGAAANVAGTSATSPSFTPDGTGVVYLNGARQPSVVPVAGGPQTLITATAVAPGTPLYRLSPDSQRIVFLEAGGILVSNPLSGAPGVTFAPVSEWDVTSDSKLVVYVAAGMMQAAPIDVGQAGATTIDDVAALLALAPDGKSVGYQGFDGTSTVVRVASLPSGSPVTIAPGTSVAFTADSAHVTYLSPTDLLGFAPTGGGATTGIMPIRADPSTTPVMPVAGGMLFGWFVPSLADPTGFENGLYFAPIP